MVAGGAALLLPIEYVATLWAYQGAISIVTAARVLALCATLLALAWMVAGPLCALALAAPRLVRALSHGDARTGAGFLAWHPRPAHPRPGAAWVWGLFVGGGVFVLGVQRVAAWAATTYKEPQRIGFLIAPYIAGPYVEGSYDVTLPVTPALLAKVKPGFRDSFSVAR